MELTSEQEKSLKLLQIIINKAWQEIFFIEELIDNPIDAIKKATGQRVKLPEGKTLIVNDQTDKAIIYINIPAEPSFEDMELSENQLEIVAAGGSIWLPFISIPTLIVDQAKDVFFFKLQPNILTIKFKIMELTGEQKFYADIVQKAWDDAELKKN